MLEYIAPVPAVTVTPAPVVKNIALAPAFVATVPAVHWRQRQRQWQSSSRQCLQRQWRPLQPCVQRLRLWQSTPHVSCRVINASSNRACNASASVSVHLAMLVVSVATAPSVFAARALVVEYVAPVPAVAMAPVPTVHAAPPPVAGCIAPVHSESVAPANPVRDSTTSCSDRSASAGGSARRTGCCCVRSTCASGGTYAGLVVCVVPAPTACAAPAPMAEHSSCASSASCQRRCGEKQSLVLPSWRRLLRCIAPSSLGSWFRRAWPGLAFTIRKTAPEVFTKAMLEVDRALDTANTTLHRSQDRSTTTTS